MPQYRGLEQRTEVQPWEISFKKVFQLQLRPTRGLESKTEQWSVLKVQITKFAVALISALNKILNYIHLYTDTPKFHFNKFKQIWSKRLREQNWNGNLFLPRLDCNLMHCFINYLEAAFLSQIEISHHNTL